jgi:hypothetical protein
MSEQTNDRITPDDWTEEPTGDGGPMGVGSTDGGHDMPAGSEVEEGAVVSGGGLVDKDDIDPEDAPEALTDLD